jgi:hypothetical protein
MDYKPKRHMPEDEPAENPPDARLKQIQGVRTNRLSRLEREKQQAQQLLDEKYSEMAKSRPNAAQGLWRTIILEPILEDYYLGQDVYMQNLRRWMEQTQALKPQIENIASEQAQFSQDCLVAQKNLEEKIKEVKTLVLQIEKLKLLQENWT